MFFSIRRQIGLSIQLQADKFLRQILISFCLKTIFITHTQRGGTAWAPGRNLINSSSCQLNRKMILTSDIVGSRHTNEFLACSGHKSETMFAETIFISYR